MLVPPSVLEPGLVYLEQALGKEQQEQLVDIAVQEGESARGFYNAQGRLNSTPSRGRIYDRLDRFPVLLRDVCLDLVNRARQADPAMPAMTPTHLLLLKYTSHRGMGLHRDDGENDGAGEFPVVSVSIGNTCSFALKHERQSPTQCVPLHSGDAVLFGGPCRTMLHSVTQVSPGTAPAWLPPCLRDARLNFTFRHAPEILGRELAFAVYRPGDRSKEHQRFGPPPADTQRSQALGGEAPSHEAEGSSASQAGEPRRLCHLDGRPYTRAEFQRRHGETAETLWLRAPPGPAAAAEGAVREAEVVLKQRQEAAEERPRPWADTAQDAAAK